MLHDQTGNPLIDKRSEHLDHVGVVKVCLDFSLSQELISVLLLLRKRGKKRFNDDLSPENKVSCKIELAHPASLKALPNNVILDLLSWVEFGFRQLRFPLSLF